MAKGTATGESLVVSQVRTGCKRELQFVLKSQSEICGGESLGRTRASKNSYSDSRSTDLKKKQCLRRSGLKNGIKKMRLVKDEEEEVESVVVISGTVEEEEEEEEEEDEGSKSDVVDIDEGKGLFSDSMSVEEEKKIENVVMKEAEKETWSVIEREIVVACPAKLSLLPKLASRSCCVKLERDVVYEKPGRRLTRSMSKSEGVKSEANGGDEDHEIPESEAKCNGDGCVDASTSVAYVKEEEQMSVDPCLVHPNGASEASSDKNAVNDTVDKPLSGDTLVIDDKKAVSDTIDKPLRRFTRSLIKQESDLDSPDLENKTESEPANDVEMVDVQSPLVTTTPNKRGRPKKYSRNFPAKLKELFDCGILEGLTVYYIRCAKMREAGTRGLKGVINGSSVLCFCGSCKGNQVVSPAVFEQHASSANKRPPEYTLLESGYTLRDVMNAIKETPLASIEEKLRLVVGSALKKSSLCLSCQGPMVEPCDTKSLVLCKSCFEGKDTELHTSPCKANDDLNGLSTPIVAPRTVLGRSMNSPGQSKKREQPPRKSSEPSVVPGTSPCESKSSSVQSKSQGKLTRKDLRLHKLVFEDDILPDGTEVGYFLAGKKMLVGYKKGFGIHCSCCNKVVSPSSFEAHAGCASRRRPFHHIYTTNGVSLHELSVVLSMDQRFSIRENDDLCTICKDGGELLCCDTCPRSYHTVCASLPSLPSERWSCKYCVSMIEREKFVDSNPNAIAAGRVQGVDAIAEISKRCIRIVSELPSELPSVCVLCRGNTFSRLGFNPRTVIICDQCEKEFHVGCLKEHKIADLEELPEDKWFCSHGCKNINTTLGSLIDDGGEKVNDNFLDFVMKKHKPDEESCPDDKTTPDIRWRVLSGKLTSSDDTKALLAKAVSILHERFDPISESGTRGDLIPAMVYGRETKAQDFSGMYCTMLTVDEVIVSVGIFRIFGSELAELPLVATSKDCQGKGYFQCLFACIEKLLGGLNVKHLVLPAADEAKSIWTDKFGFTKMSEEEVKGYREDYSVMVFHGTSMLRKTVPAKPEDSMEE
uniref:Chromodomain-helicase-DNA-binding protein 4 n=1 Tax=Noccaea caerulescens TaxID=107243 RepID=A0A1J3EIH4_NOCCA